MAEPLWTDKDIKIAVGACIDNAAAMYAMTHAIVAKRDEYEAEIARLKAEHSTVLTWAKTAYDPIGVKPSTFSRGI